MLVGDCYGVDSSVQKFYADIGYDRVTIYASNGKARNNVGKWNIKNVPVSAGVHGFDFYRQKDIAMARDADYGMMIWDGKSRGTMNNILTMFEQGKPVLVFLPNQNRSIVVNSQNRLDELFDAAKQDP